MIASHPAMQKAAETTIAPFRPIKSAPLPLRTAPSIAPTFNIEPKTEY
uniref:Uncharacterized protein n=1 Tax=Rhizophora mucronata TaxID=61149 RepID=A0A2P2QAC7_RHIMU